jgi:hypothetical protein
LTLPPFEPLLHDATVERVGTGREQAFGRRIEPLLHDATVEWVGTRREQAFGRRIEPLMHDATVERVGTGRLAPFVTVRHELNGDRVLAAESPATSASFMSARHDPWLERVEMGLPAADSCLWDTDPLPSGLSGTMLPLFLPFSCLARTSAAAGGPSAGRQPAEHEERKVVGG